mgnify:CR=1 FL=1
MQVRELVSYVRRRAAEESGGAAARHAYQSARVVAVRPLGMGDRACVDLAGLLQVRHGGGGKVGWAGPRLRSMWGGGESGEVVDASPN